tara:strand:+ start:1104 stop:2195 length:1092 start_codon:yes stop_codon:yes gene_type:complete
MNSHLNFRDMSVKELKDICRGEPQKYRGFSSLKKEDLIHFMYQKNSTSQRSRHRCRPSYNLADVSHVFETPDEYEERIQGYYDPKPEETIIEDLISTLRSKYPLSTILFDPHNDPNNDLIYKGNKGKYIKQHGSLGEYGEDILYHGTDEKNLISILNDDFRLTSNPIHGSIYGKGIYFTNDIEKALYYSERGKSKKYVIVCNVHIGDICQGYSTMDIHPKMRDRDKQYDTSVDNIRSPKQFIKKKNGTYNILGIITIQNYKDSQNNKFTGGFQLINTLDSCLSLYWIPPNVWKHIYDVDIKKCKKLSIIPSSHNSNHGTTKQLCQIGHYFACVAHFSTDLESRDRDSIIRIFRSKRKGEIITI